jgi:hypothetical protein
MGSEEEAAAILNDERLRQLREKQLKQKKMTDNVGRNNVTWSEWSVAK